jgi:predicted transcriptional regulator
MAVECTDKTNQAELEEFLKKAGAVEVNVQEVETGWWIGRYDREQKLYRDAEPAHA